MNIKNKKRFWYGYVCSWIILGVAFALPIHAQTAANLSSQCSLINDNDILNISQKETACDNDPNNCVWYNKLCMTDAERVSFMNFSNADCGDHPAATCETFVGCKLEGDICKKKGFLGIGNGVNNDLGIANDGYCTGQYMPTAWNDPNKAPDTSIPWQNIMVKQVSPPSWTLITAANYGSNPYKQAENTLKNACKKDPRCKWGGGQCKGKSSGGTEDDVILAQTIADTNTSCIAVDSKYSESVTNASTDSDLQDALQARDTECLQVPGCHLEATPDERGQCRVNEDYFYGTDASLDNFEMFKPYSGPTFNGPGLRAGARIAKVKLDNTISKERSLKNLIIKWSQFALSITATLAVIALIYAGILYITDMGNGSNQEKAKKILIYVAVGIIVIMGSYAIVNTLMKARFGAQVGFEPITKTIAFVDIDHLPASFQDSFYPLTDESVPMTNDTEFEITPYYDFPPLYRS